MPKTRDLPLNDYPSGSRSIVKQTPNGLDGFKIEIGRCTTADPTIWPDPATLLTVMITPSYDGGNTFDPTARIGFSDASGGIRVNDKTGQEITVQDLGGSFDPPANAVKVDITVVNGPIRTFADITVL